MSSIALRQHILYVGHSPFAHNFLVLYDDQGNVVSELHGLAYDPVSRKFVPRGRSEHNLRAREYFGKSELNVDGQPESILLQRPGDDLTAIWKAAKDAHEQINSRNLTYNFWGSDLNGPRDWDAPVPDVIAGNSNSVNRTLIEAMGLKAPSMPMMAPGTETQLLP
jgi:hypothetical protein